MYFFLHYELENGHWSCCHPACEPQVEYHCLTVSPCCHMLSQTQRYKYNYELLNAKACDSVFYWKNISGKR